VKIVFDMDNTLADEFGGERRPGIEALLDALVAEGHELSLWTSSTKARAVEILERLDLARYFNECLFREDYDPENKGAIKDIRRIDGAVLIDDDPKQVAFTNGIKKLGIEISAYRGGEVADDGELDRIHARINKNRGLLGRLFGYGGFIRPRPGPPPDRR
jgi:beta-phosphoglucomutase-like phosphatase (HAD superfamily)